MRCSSCENLLLDDEVRYAWDEPYCESCFDDLFNHCCHCDELITSSSTHYQDGDPYCEECWSETYDDNAPENPEVTESDRTYIIHLSRTWLEGKTDYRRFININDKDLHLKLIREKVGLVESSIYLFGLRDRDEYQISASSNIIEEVREYALLNLSGVIIVEGIGSSRLGVSLSLRENNRHEIIELIKQITKVKELVPA